MPAYLPATFFGGPIFHVYYLTRAMGSNVLNIVFTSNIDDLGKVNKLETIETADNSIIVREPVAMVYRLSLIHI